MQELIWLIDSVRAFFSGGWEELQMTSSFWALMLLGAVLVPPTLIFMGIADDGFHDTPLGRWFGLEDDDGYGWKKRPDLDGDGLPD